MVAWYWLIVAFMGGVAISVFFENYKELLFYAAYGLTFIIIFLPMGFYFCFLRNTIHPVSVERWENITNNPDFMRNNKFTHLFGNFYFWQDNDASKFWKKYFFVRVDK